jgi:N-acetylglucosaminyldiphosphoundecaprenol N-acetyl-beta-D-mannosaminyltransferase
MRFWPGKDARLREIIGSSGLADCFERNVHCLLGLPFDAVDMAGALIRIREAVAQHRPCFFSTPNLNFLVACLTDDSFRQSVIDSDLSIVDGMPLVWVARLLRVPIRVRVSGSDLFGSLQADGAGPISVFFFGGPEGVAEVACRRLNERPSGLFCVGYESPGFGSVEEMSGEATVARINASGADFVVVALGARKGQAWIARNRARLSAPVIGHLGAMVNFIAGTVNRAPSWLQRSGLEWLWRIKEEPVLWRRYFSDGAVFLWLLVTRVLPYAVLVSWRRPSVRELAEARAEAIDNGSQVVIRLRGPWVMENLRPLRGCLSRLVAPGKGVRFEMECVTYVDSAFIGLLILVQGDLRRQGRSMSIANVPPRVRWIFRFACAEFLLETR